MLCIAYPAAAALYDMLSAEAFGNVAAAISASDGKAPEDFSVLFGEAFAEDLKKGGLDIRGFAEKIQYANYETLNKLCGIYVFDNDSKVGFAPVCYVFADENSAGEYENFLKGAVYAFWKDRGIENAEIYIKRDGSHIIAANCEGDMERVESLLKSSVNRNSKAFALSQEIAAMNPYYMKFARAAKANGEDGELVYDPKKTSFTLEFNFVFADNSDTVAEYALCRKNYFEVSTIHKPYLPLIKLSIEQYGEVSSGDGNVGATVSEGVAK